MARPSDRFRQTITYAAVTGRDSYGRPTLGSQSTAAARVQPSRRTIRDAAGERVEASYVVYVAVEFTLATRLWLPGDNTGISTASRRILAIDPYADGVGAVSYYRVWV